MRSELVAACVAAIALAGCGSDEGLLSVSLATAPGSTLLDSVQTLQLVITNPRQELAAERTGDGFDISVDLAASGVSTALLVDGFDASGSRIASGASPTFVLGGVDGQVVVYMAAPNTLGAAPVALDVARSQMGTAPLIYGAILAGGVTASGTASDLLAIYNAYNHTLTAGRPLPAPRIGPAIGVGTLGVYMFGGTDDAGNATGSLWRFDPTVAPAGTYFDYGAKPDFARSHALLAPLGNERFVLSGTPPVEMLGGDGSLVVRDGVPHIPAAGAVVMASDGVPTAIFAGTSAVIRCRTGSCETLEVPGKPGTEVVPLPNGRVGLVCGIGGLVVIDAATGAQVESVPGIPATERSTCAAAATSRHLVVAGGTNASGLAPDAEVYDLATLSLVATSPLTVPRQDATAIPLANDQILILDGVDGSGAPISTLELFTPGNPL